MTLGIGLFLICPLSLISISRTQIHSQSPTATGGGDLFSWRSLLCLLLFALKGTNSIHSYDNKAVIHKNKESKKIGGGKVGKCDCPKEDEQMRKKKFAEWNSKIQSKTPWESLGLQLWKSVLVFRYLRIMSDDNTGKNCCADLNQPGIFPILPHLIRRQKIPFSIWFTLHLQCKPICITMWRSEQLLNLT